MMCLQPIGTARFPFGYIGQSLLIVICLAEEGQFKMVTHYLIKHRQAGCRDLGAAEYRN